MLLDQIEAVPTKTLGKVMKRALRNIRAELLKDTPRVIVTVGTPAPCVETSV
jgi:hypothetical protein